ncbi:MAG TPA: type VI secretion system baseplate subunit TssK [Steroidobacteraceae bacterium]|jgi:type VI secretion system protein ImpJ|nr:type VI secretion system baseplate subunit TssK [Steroidobacteraceae bacterium]
MSENNRIVWSEGLFLRQQHFQQQERHLESWIEGRAAALRPYSWGFTELEIERDLLAIGKIGLRRARGVFPDGTPFAMPENEPLPPPLEVGTQLRDQVILLAVPLRKSGALLSTRPGNGVEFTRYRTRDQEVRDVAMDSATVTELEVAALNTRLMAQSEPVDDFACIPLAHVVECRADRQVVLDDRFIPSVLKAGTAGRLATFLMELQGLLHQRAEALAARAVASGRGGASEIADFLMLQVINRYEPVVAHLASSPALHPEDLYRLTLEITGELSTLTTTTRRPPQFPTYKHDALRASFEPVINALRGCLSVVMEQNAIPIPLAHKKFGISVASVADQSLFDSAAFVLAARADVPAEELRRRFPAQLKIGPVEKIRDLVNLQLPGVGLQAMPVAPRQIPYHAGFAYFELDRSSDLWRGLKGSGGIAIHQSGDFPNLAMELWAIRA